MKNRKIIHVNRHHIAANQKDGGTRPIYTIKVGGKVRYAREVAILGPSRLVYDAKGLSCGAKAWIETDSPVDLVDEMGYQEASRATKENQHDPEGTSGVDYS